MSTVRSATPRLSTVKGGCTIGPTVYEDEDGGSDPIIALNPSAWFKPGDYTFGRWADSINPVAGDAVVSGSARPPIGPDNLGRDVPHFDGANDSLRTAILAQSATLPMVGIVVWVDTLDAATQYISDGNSDVDANRFGVNIRATSDFLAMYDGDTSDISAMVIPSGQWVRIIAHSSGIGKFIHLDGADISLPQTAGGDPLTAITLGAQSGGGGSFFDGFIAEYIAIPNPSNPLAAAKTIDDYLVANHGLGLGDTYFRPGGIDNYLRPGGVDTYLRP